MKLLFLFIYALALFAVPVHASAVTPAEPRTLKVNGVERTYMLHLPAQADKTRKLPLIIAMHGGGGTGRDQIQLTLGGFNYLSDREGIVIAYPDALHKRWNDGRQAMARMNQNADDTAFILQLIDRLVADHNVDPKRVYLTGISNGAQMSFRLACEYADRFAAIAPVAGAMSEELHAYCKPSRPLPVLMINGTDDPLRPWAGGYTTGFIGAHKLGKTLSVADTIKFWLRNNQCLQPAVSAWEQHRAPADSTRIKHDTYTGCKDGADVVLFTVQGGGHTWPGGMQYLPERLIGKTSRHIDANMVIWDFFSRHQSR